jgi:hypothetical protein
MATATLNQVDRESAAAEAAAISDLVDWIIDLSINDDITITWPVASKQR